MDMTTSVGSQPMRDRERERKKKKTKRVPAGGLSVIDERHSSLYALPPPLNGHRGNEDEEGTGSTRHKKKRTFPLQGAPVARLTFCFVLFFLSSFLL